MRATGREPDAAGRSGRPAAGDRGVALVLVLLVAALLGLAAVSLAFLVTLDTLAARNVQETVLAEGQVEGALALAARAAAAHAPPVSGARFGPWPELGIEASVDAVWDADGTIRFRGRAQVGRSSVTGTLVARLPDGEVPAIVSRP